MFALLYAYLCVPRRFRFIVRCLAACFVLAVVVMVLIFFSQILGTVPKHRGRWFQPPPHQSTSPDFTSVFPRRVRED